MLQCVQVAVCSTVAVRGSVLPYVVVCCRVLQSAEVYRSILHWCVAVCCNVWKYGAIIYSQIVLQYVGVCLSQRYRLESYNYVYFQLKKSPNWNYLYIHISNLNLNYRYIYFQLKFLVHPSVPPVAICSNHLIYIKHQID